MTRYDRMKKKAVEVGYELIARNAEAGRHMEGLIDNHFYCDAIWQAIPEKFSIEWAAALLIEAPTLFIVSTDDMPQAEEPSVKGLLRTVLRHTIFYEIRDDLYAKARSLGLPSEETTAVGKEASAQP